MKKIVETSKAAAPIGPYNQAVWAGDILYISGQVALDAKTGTLENGDIQAQTHRVMKNLGAILAEAGLDFENVVKCHIFTVDLQKFAAINEVYSQYFDEATAPARETIQAGALPKGALVEISAIAFKKP